MNKDRLQTAIEKLFVSLVIQETLKGLVKSWLIPEDKEQRMDTVIKMLSCRTRTYINLNTSMAGTDKHKSLNLLRSSGEERYLYFIRKISDFEEVWGLYNEGWALLEDENKQTILPFWPEEYFAKICAQEVWEGYTPMAVSLDDFINKWLPGMTKDDTLASIFLTPEGKGVVVHPRKLLDDIDNELEQY